jgi:hypothetical protein
MTAAYIEIMRNQWVQNADLLIFKTGGTYNYHWALKL